MPSMKTAQVLTHYGHVAIKTSVNPAVAESSPCFTSLSVSACNSQLFINNSYQRRQLQTYER